MHRKCLSASYQRILQDIYSRTSTLLSMRFINDIIIHCSATREKVDIGAKEIREWHTSPPPMGNGWRDIGYHYIIRLDGTVELGRRISKAGAHCYGHNAHSIGICYVGGLDSIGEPTDTRTAAQKSALLKLITNLIKVYRCDVHGHRDYTNAKECPCFDAHKEYTNIYRRLVGIPEER